MITLDTYIISDTHFRHANIVKYCGRDANHDEIMRRNWMETVAEETYLGKLGEAPVVMPIGPVAWWWDTDEYQHWETPEHWHYVAWRSHVNDVLVDTGYLVYRHWEAFKGTWNNKMQKYNNLILADSDYIVSLCPSDSCGWWPHLFDENCAAGCVPSEGSIEEIAECERLGKPVIHAQPPPMREPQEDVFEEASDRLLVLLAQS